jgi:acyl-CoA thioester hydrolase
MKTDDVRAKIAQRPAHRLALRVYYEDTDFSGRVYHASYLRFMERGRTEWLRARGFAQQQMAQGSAITFVVRSLAIDFVKPALMDDMLTIETRLANLGAASFEFAQAIWRDDERLAVADVRVVALKSERPARLPPELRARLTSEGG